MKELLWAYDNGNLIAKSTASLKKVFGRTLLPKNTLRTSMPSLTAVSCYAGNSASVAVSCADDNPLALVPQAPGFNISKQKVGAYWHRLFVWTKKFISK